MRIIYLIPAVLLLVFCGPVLAVTIVGQSVDDAIDQVNGVCSLREAVLDARAQSDPASFDTNLTLSGTEAPTAMFLEGGTVGAFLDIDQGATLHLSGGSIGDKLEVFDGGRLNIIGSEFFIDGQPLTGLVLDEVFEVTQRGGAVLSGTVLDGGSFSIDLNASNPSGDLLADVFYGTAMLTVTRSDQPSDPGDPGDDRIFGDAFLLPDPRVGQMP